LQLGKVALQTSGVVPEDASFRAQQCAEKSLKALLIIRKIHFPRTHAIEVLLGLLKENSEPVPENVEEAFFLTEYAVQSRYPGEWEPATKKEALSALEQAALVLSWVESRI
jgi:HEPN domain-containing protein